MSKSKKVFVETAPPLELKVGGNTFTATPRTFSTGSVGYNIDQKFSIRMPDGQTIEFKFAGNAIATKSKEWPE